MQIWSFHPTSSLIFFCGFQIVLKIRIQVFNIGYKFLQGLWCGLCFNFWSLPLLTLTVCVLPHQPHQTFRFPDPRSFHPPQILCICCSLCCGYHPLLPSPPPSPAPPPPTSSPPLAPASPLHHHHHLHLHHHLHHYSITNTITTTSTCTITTCHRDSHFSFRSPLTFTSLTLQPRYVFLSFITFSLVCNYILPHVWLVPVSLVRP